MKILRLQYEEGKLFILVLIKQVIIWKGKTQNLGWKNDEFWQSVFKTRDVALPKLASVQFPDIIPNEIMKVMGVFYSLFSKTCF